MTAFNIGDALFSKTQQRVLGLLFNKPDSRFYANEIVRHADMGRGTVRRELDRLVAAGILTSSREGNQRYYQANPDSPVYPELLAIVRKTFGVAEVIRGALAGLDDHIDMAFVYGSVASASDVKTSDIDLMVIGNSLMFSDVMNTLLPAEESLARTINPSIYTINEFRLKLKKDNSFLRRVTQRPKLWVKGGEDDIGSIG